MRNPACKSGLYDSESSMSVIKERLAAGKIVRTMHVVGYATPRVIELVGTLGNFHGVWFDQEHSAIPHADLELMLIACRAAGKDAFARVPPTDYATVMRPMEAGCSGVMIAQVRTLDEVKQAVEWAKYPPVGKRGFFGGNVETRFGKIDMATHVADARIAIAGCRFKSKRPKRSRSSTRSRPSKGVDWLFVGPADLSVTLGVPGDFCIPSASRRLKRVAAATKKAGKAWGMLSRDVEHARRCRELGCQLFSIFGDIDCLRVGLRDVGRAIRGFAWIKYDQVSR